MLVGAVTVLIVIVGVYLAYNANKGLPFVPTYDLKAELPSGGKLVKGNEVRVGGFRVGVVKDLKPEVRMVNGERRSVAVADLALDKKVEPLARDSKLRAVATRENPMQYHIDAFDDPGPLPHLDAVLFDADPSAFADYDAARRTLRLSTLLPHARVLEALVDDPRFRTNPDRVRNREALVTLLEERLRTAPAEHWLERLRAAGVPAAPVADVRDVADAPQTEALGILQDLPHPSIPRLRLPALPLSFDRERALHRAPHPPSASTRPRSSPKPATTPTRSRRSPHEE